MTINTADCLKCIYGELVDNKKIHCKYRDKTYFYGQRIPCDDGKRDKDKN